MAPVGSVAAAAVAAAAGGAVFAAIWRPRVVFGDCAAAFRVGATAAVGAFAGLADRGAAVMTGGSVGAELLPSSILGVSGINNVPVGADLSFLELAANE